MNNGRKASCYWGAFFMQFLAVGVCIGFHRLFIHMGKQIASPEMINGEMSDPTIGRMIYAFISFLLFVGLTVLASKLNKKGKEFLAFSSGVFAGIFLWQSIGEDAWHFSMNGMHFACLESIQVLPLVILFVLFMLYCAKHNSLDFGLWCSVLSFATNWLGHYILIGIYPIVMDVIDEKMWCKIIGIIIGILAFATGIFLGLKKSKTNKQMMLSSILTYYGVGVLMFGIMG